MEYSLKLERKKLNVVVKNLADKLVDWCSKDLYNADEINIHWMEVYMNQASDKYQFINQLNKVWQSLNLSERQSLCAYLQVEMELTFNKA